ncbi:hypothetical protein GALMADRAFT_232930 [Galerina marginata CBS 339.88]|uniref:Uncharacterized protein n=1 Tax=Galerina marginata (strain CBS 339.88) TaxID=685588 RepID=A0A067S6E1_GALM3|nr:hypothetical protein GALMADRAFT_232930 [Galerina marginata CBS 339.88]
MQTNPPFRGRWASRGPRFVYSAIPRTAVPLPIPTHFADDGIHWDSHNHGPQSAPTNHARPPIPHSPTTSKTRCRNAIRERFVSHPPPVLPPTRRHVLL